MIDLLLFSPLIIVGILWGISLLRPEKPANRYDRYVIRGLPVMAKTQLAVDSDKARKAQFWAAVSNRLEAK